MGSAVHTGSGGLAALQTPLWENLEGAGPPCTQHKAQGVLAESVSPVLLGLTPNKSPTGTIHGCQVARMTPAKTAGALFTLASPCQAAASPQPLAHGPSRLRPPPPAGRRPAHREAVTDQGHWPLTRGAAAGAAPGGSPRPRAGPGLAGWTPARPALTCHGDARRAPGRARPVHLPPSTRQVVCPPPARSHSLRPFPAGPPPGRPRLGLGGVAATVPSRPH